MKTKPSLLERIATHAVLTITFCISIGGSADAAIIVYNNYATSSLGLGQYDGRYGPILHPEDQYLTYSGRTDFDIGLGGGAYPTNVTASRHNFSMSAAAQAEGFFTRIAQADAYWEFTVADTDSTFTINGTVFCGALSWALQDLTALGDPITGALGPTAGDGHTWNGILLLGHSYQLTEGVRTCGTSDESATLDFSPATGVVFIPELSTMALVALGAGVLALRRGSRHV